MSVIPYYSNPDAVKAFAWACKTAMYSVFGPNAFINVDKKTVRNLKQLGIELYPLNWGGHFSILFGRMHSPEAAQVIMVANAATYAERYAKKVDLKDVASQVAGWANSCAPPQEAMERVREDDLPHPEERLAWSILGRAEYNIYPEVVFGDFALKLAHQLRDALADLIMYVNTGL